MNNYLLSFSINPEEFKKRFTLLSIEPKYKYENGKKTSTYEAQTLTFLAEGSSLLKVHIDNLSMKPLQKLKEYTIVFDEERTRPYCQNNFVKYTVWAKDVKEVDGE